MRGHVTSSYYSPTLGRSIALAMVAGGAGHGERLYVATLHDDHWLPARSCHPVFYHPQGVRQHA